jgi:hypothetical protein
MPMEARAVDPALERELGDLVAHEAALLDARRFDDWLALFAPDGRYWVPLQGARQAEGAQRLGTRVFGQRVEEAHQHVGAQQQVAPVGVAHLAAGGVEDQAFVQCGHAVSLLQMKSWIAGSGRSGASRSTRLRRIFQVPSMRARRCR